MNHSGMTKGGASKALAERAPRSRWWKLIALLAMLAAWTYVFLAGDGGWLDLRQQRQSLATMTAEVERLQALNDSLRTVLERMEVDPEFLEKVAREKFGMVKPGEHLYRIKRPEPDSD